MVVEMINPVFEKYKNTNFIFRECRNKENRFIDIEIVGYNRDYPHILIGKLNSKKGISGFKDLSSFDIVENHEKGSDYMYINRELLEEKPRREIKVKKNSEKRRENLIPNTIFFN